MNALSERAAAIAITLAAVCALLLGAWLVLSVPTYSGEPLAPEPADTAPSITTVPSPTESSTPSGSPSPTRTASATPTRRATTTTTRRATPAPSPSTTTKKKRRTEPPATNGDGSGSEPTDTSSTPVIPDPPVDTATTAP